MSEEKKQDSAVAQQAEEEKFVIIGREEIPSREEAEKVAQESLAIAERAAALKAAASASKDGMEKSTENEATKADETKEEGANNPSVPVAQESIAIAAALKLAAARESKDGIEKPAENEGAKADDKKEEGAINPSVPTAQESIAIAAALKIAALKAAATDGMGKSAENEGSKADEKTEEGAVNRGVPKSPPKSESSPVDFRSHVPSSGTVVLAVDGSEHAQHAWDYYVNSLHRGGRKVKIVHAVENSSDLTYGKGVIEKYTRLVEEQKVDNPEAWSNTEVKLLTVPSKPPASPSKSRKPEPSGWEAVGLMILAEAEADGNCPADMADMIIMGTRGDGKQRKTILGGVSDYVVHHTKCPVIVCRPPRDEKECEQQEPQKTEEQVEDVMKLHQMKLDDKDEVVTQELTDGGSTAMGVQVVHGKEGKQSQDEEHLVTEKELSKDITDKEKDMVRESTDKVEKEKDMVTESTDKVEKEKDMVTEDEKLQVVKAHGKDTAVSYGQSEDEKEKDDSPEKEKIRIRDEERQEKANEKVIISEKITCEKDSAIEKEYAKEGKLAEDNEDSNKKIIG